MGGAVAWFCVVVLAVVQGLTEFLPISSSGHLIIVKEMLGFKSPGVRLEVVLHLGTLLAVVAYYRRRLLELLTGVLHGDRMACRMVGLLVLSMVPAGIFWALFNKPLDELFADTRLAAKAASGLLLVTGLLLLSLKWVRDADGDEVKPMQAWWIGCMQAVAILPGISRSGSTITVARHLGLRPDKAAEFSFLMSIPILVAGAAVDFMHSQPAQADNGLGIVHYLVGIAVAAIVGYLAIGTLICLLCRGRFWYFAVYCLCAGSASLAWLLL